MSPPHPIVLTVAGSDPSGGAGLQADLKTIHAHRGYGAAVPTLITVQTTRGVEDVFPLQAELVRAQLAALLGDIEPSAAKTGALGSAAVVRLLGSVMEAARFPWVVDPIWLPSRGRPLASANVVDAYREWVIPHAALVTPNLEEAAQLTGLAVRDLEDARLAAARLVELGARAALVKGGHLEGAVRGTDVLAVGGDVHQLAADEIYRGPFHGTGCALSAAIATRLAFGDGVLDAVVHAKTWLSGALAHAFEVGKGARPVNHLWRMPNEA